MGGLRLRCGVPVRALLAGAVGPRRRFGVGPWRQRHDQQQRDGAGEQEREHQEQRVAHDVKGAFAGYQAVGRGKGRRRIAGERRCEHGVQRREPEPLRRPVVRFEQGALRRVGVEHTLRRAQDHRRQPGFAHQLLRGSAKTCDSGTACHEVDDGEILLQKYFGQLAVGLLEVTGGVASTRLPRQVEPDRQEADQDQQKGGGGDGEQAQQERMVGEAPPVAGAAQKRQLHGR